MKKSQFLKKKVFSLFSSSVPSITFFSSQCTLCGVFNSHKHGLYRYIFGLLHRRRSTEIGCLCQLTNFEPANGVCFVRTIISNSNASRPRSTASVVDKK